MQWSAAAERHQCERARIETALDRYDAQDLRHLRIDQRDDPRRRARDVPAERRGNRCDGRVRARRIDRKRSADERDRLYAKWLKAVERSRDWQER